MSKAPSEVNIFELVRYACIIGERAKRARHYQECTNSSWSSICINMCKGTCRIIVAHARIHNVGRVRPQPLFLRASRFNVVTNGKGSGTKTVLKGTVCMCLCLVSSLMSTALLL